MTSGEWREQELLLMREVMRLWPDAPDKELYYRALDRFYAPQAKWTIETLSGDTVPSMDSLVRRAREVREEERRQKRYPRLFV